MKNRKNILENDLLSELKKDFDEIDWKEIKQEFDKNFEEIKEGTPINYETLPEEVQSFKSYKDNLIQWINSLQKKFKVFNF